MSDGRPVMIMAGGTGGHIFPGLAVAEVLSARAVPVVWLGAAGALETRLVPARGIRLLELPVRGVRGKGWNARLRAPWMLLGALRAAWAALRRERPRSVLALGGYAAGPGGLAAFLRRVPLVVHEQNAMPGMTNRVLARLARRVLVGFPDALPQATCSGNPVRAAIAALLAPAQRFAARTGRARLLVLGGSQGARALNLGVPAALALLPAAGRPEVWHQCGAQGVETTRAAYAEAGIEARIEPFIETMEQAYAWADLALCRAGALTLAELAAAGLGAILVPYPHAVDDHQTRNAAFMTGADAARLLPESALSAQSLAQELGTLLADRKRLLSMATAARALAQPDAADRIADACLEVAR
ncbi:N-acetylglucosaminyltransferase, MurG [mine drainage metagenome]|uniref:N-acetylglucosaminyltransferase, MurG n=3 Tax=mine drainage metagenome TaxID=410659 RepID=T1BAX3_9ZZZZ